MHPRCLWGLEVELPLGLVCMVGYWGHDFVQEVSLVCPESVSVADRVRVGEATWGGGLHWGTLACSGGHGLQR